MHSNWKINNNLPVDADAAGADQVLQLLLDGWIIQIMFLFLHQANRLPGSLGLTSGIIIQPTSGSLVHLASSVFVNSLQEINEINDQ